MHVQKVKLHQEINVYHVHQIVNNAVLKHNVQHVTHLILFKMENVPSHVQKVNINPQHQHNQIIQLKPQIIQIQLLQTKQDYYKHQHVKIVIKNAKIVQVLLYVEDVIQDIN